MRNVVNTLACTYCSSVLLALLQLNARNVSWHLQEQEAIVIIKAVKAFPYRLTGLRILILFGGDQTLATL